MATEYLIVKKGGPHEAARLAGGRALPYVIVHLYHAKRAPNPFFGRPLGSRYRLPSGVKMRLERKPCANLSLTAAQSTVGHHLSVVLVGHAGVRATSLVTVEYVEEISPEGQVISFAE